MEDYIQHPNRSLRLSGHAIRPDESQSGLPRILINEALQDMLNHFVFVYLYDILIFSKSLHEHVSLAMSGKLCNAS